jgi:hypothetical protein
MFYHVILHVYSGSVRNTGLAAAGCRRLSLGVQEIAREKAGIFKPGVPAFTVPQPQDAMDALQVCTLCNGSRTDP